MKRHRTIKRPTTPPVQPHCGACLLTKSYLQRRRDTYECSRIDCPERRRVTADATPKVSAND